MPMPCRCHCTNARQYRCVADFWPEMELAGNICDRQNSWYADKYFLCEIERVRDTSVSAPELSLLDPKWPSHMELVRCPSGHVTFNFLACDVHSHCWGRQGSYSFSCHAPLASLPPHFACADSVGRVPYSMVCDHRQDCRDNSDEDFCTFRSCTGADEFRCNNGQVCVYSKCIKCKMYCTNVLQQKWKLVLSWNSEAIRGTT